MPTLFTKIIDHEIPGTFVWADDEVVAFLTIAPLRPGHTLVVPRAEVDRWTDLPGSLAGHCLQVAGAIGRAVCEAWNAPRAGLLVAGFEIPHAHLHVFPAWSMADFDLSGIAPLDNPAELVEPAERIRAALRAAGEGAHVAG